MLNASFGKNNWHIIMIDITPEKKINTFNLMEIVK